MGLLDDPAFAEELLKKVYEQYQQKESGSPLTTGLLSAGLGILASNNGRNSTASAIGQGGLMGLQGYQQAKQMQAKDPMQLLQVAAAAQGLKQSALQNQWMQTANGQQPAPEYQPAPGLPDMRQQAYGMFDRGTGDGGQLGQMQQPLQGAMAQLDPAMLYRGIGLGGAPAAVAKAQMEAMSKTPTKFGPGDIPATFNPRTLQWEQGQQIPNLDKNMTMQGGQAIPVPGAPAALAALTGAQEAAKAAAQAQYQPVQTQQGGKPVTITAAQLAQNANGIDPRMAAAYADYLKNGGAAQGAFQYTPPADRLGVGLSKAEEAAQVQAATQAGELNKELAGGLGKYSIENLAAGHKVAEEAAYGTLPAIQEVRSKIAAGAFTGGGADTKTAILNQINGWFGTSIASPQVAQSMALKSALGVELLANAKKLGYNPTDTDARRIDDIIGRQGLSKDALLEIANMQEKWAKQAIDRHNKRLDSMESSLKDRGLPTDTIATLRVKPPENKPEAKAANPQLQSVVEEMRRRGLIQ